MELTKSQKSRISNLIDNLINETSLIAYESEGLRYSEKKRIKEEFYEELEEVL
jgi:hypothetical protein